MKALSTTSCEGETSKIADVIESDCAPMSYLMSDQFKINRLLENLYCHFLFCVLNATSGDFTKGTTPDDFQYFIFWSFAAQNTIFIPLNRKDGEKL